jgi:hypothetical protein
VISGGGVAAYSGAQYSGTLGTLPGPAVTYDANNCVTSVWVYINDSNNTQQLVDTSIPETGTPVTCTGGTWLIAGDGRSYASELDPSFHRTQTQLSATGGTYSAVLALHTQSNQTTDNSAATAPYTWVLMAGPGFTTVGAWQSQQPDVGYLFLTAAPVPTAPAIVNASNAIVNTTTYQIDNYYAGGAGLQSCAAIVASGSIYYSDGTPCYDANLIAGSDYGIAFFDVNFNVLGLEAQRVNISPATTVVPTSYYPTITAVSPAGATSIPAGSTTTSVTVTTTAPAGSINGEVGLGLSVTNVGSIYQQEMNLTPTTNPVTTTFSVSGLSVAPTSGFAGSDDLIGGLHVFTGWSF